MKMTRWRWVVGWGLVMSAGCAPSFGRLDGVLVDAQPEARPVAPGEVGQVEITRQGNQQNGEPGGAVKKGDEVATGADGIGVMTLVGAYEVIMDPNTELTIENPSIFVRWGRVIIKKLKEIKDSFTVHTEFGAAVVQGTEFVVEVSRQQKVRLTVLEGHVRVMPHGSAQWKDTVVFSRGQRVWLDTTRLTRLPELSARETDSVRRSIDHVRWIVRPSVPDLRGLPRSQAAGALGRLGLEPHIQMVITRTGQGGPEVGTVVGMSPLPGTRTKQGAQVQLEIEDQSVQVPNLMGQPLATAVQVIKRMGLRLGDTTGVVQPNAKPGTVSGMAPSPGAFVRLNTAIALSIARDSAYRPPLRATGTILKRLSRCSVPDLKGMTEAQAAQALAGANLVKGQVIDWGAAQITDQNPAAGSSAGCGSAVSYTLGYQVR